MKLYKIKPLEWEEEEYVSDVLYVVAYAAHTEFTVVRIDGKCIYEIFEDDTLNKYRCDSVEDGKRKCEAYYIENLMRDLEEVGLEYNDMSM